MLATRRWIAIESSCLGVGLGLAIALAGLMGATACASAPYAPAGARNTGGADGAVVSCLTDAVTIRAARLLDGRGGALANGVVAVRDGTIVAVGACEGPVTHALDDATLLPGLIDVHVHIDWRFQPDGRFGQRPDAPPETPAQAEAAILENARLTLAAGFTTVQSLGSPLDVLLRAAIAEGLVPGPRLLTSAGQIHPGEQRPDELRALVRAYHAHGADVIKAFAREDAPGGPARRAAAAELGAICGEARQLGIRTVVHAQTPQGILAAVQAGCSQVEHGTFADEPALRAMAEAGVYFDPNIGLVLQNYLERRAQFLGAPGYEAPQFAMMEKVVPLLGPLFNRALRAGLKMPLGSDAVAGAHGQNAREVGARVRVGGQRPMDAIVSATSLAAESLGLGETIGALAPGFEADIIAVAGDPLRDIQAVQRVTFVMKGGHVHQATAGQSFP
jgi:imidazolonepropionase-like amidohydrolase